MKITKHIKLSDRPLKGIFLSDKLVVRTDLLLSPAERGVVEVGPDANHCTRAVEEQPGQHQQSPPPLAGAAKHKQDVDLRKNLERIILTLSLSLSISTRMETKMLAAIMVSRLLESSTCKEMSFNIFSYFF